MMFSNKTLEYGNRLMTALLGVDTLYRSENEDGEGLAVVNMDTAAKFSPESFESYSRAKECFLQLKSEAVGLLEADRKVYYEQLCHSTLAFITWRDKGLDFASQLGDFLHVPVQPASEKELDDLRVKMRDLLNHMGYNGDLKAQCAAWEQRNRVPADEVLDVSSELMEQAWGRTEDRLFKIPALKSDAMRVVAVSDVSYNARCDYLNRKIELNTDPILTRSGLKHLAVHEGYPGHYVQFKIRETMAQDGTAPADGLLSVVNTASSSVFEGIGDAGMKMLDWIETDDDVFIGLVNRYRAGIGTGAAWRLHALGWSKESVADWLHSQSLAGGEGWVANRMGFITAPSRAVLIWSYWWGERVVVPAWEKTPVERRPDFLKYLYGRMHSNKTVGMFQ